MGQQIECRMTFNGQQHSGKALLETDEIIFRGDIRLKIPRQEICKVQTDAGELMITYTEGTAVFDLGKSAARWAEKILHPPTRIDKFGIGKGASFATLGPIDAEFLQELLAAGAVEQDDPEVMLLAAPDKQSLAALSSLNVKTVWIIYPKGVRSITEADVLKAGRSAGLVDTKVVFQRHSRR